ncbi:uncharacterized protein LOC134190372 [Corticium candelabrum]|uniref:uncharacterized protein LOC134190372 n=1 Tax=Corticium candelabrum TaxID=121492 RepID=UPI002E260288|nr:uncharacterized protein LOC134190372 [Corticium candelabrum]
MAGTGFSTTFREESTNPAPLSNDLKITDIDVLPNTNIKTATITVEGGGAEHHIHVDAQGLLGISGQDTHMVTLTNSASSSVYENVLGTATYWNSADEPSASIFKIQFQVQDADDKQSSISEAQVHIDFICDPLVLLLDEPNTNYSTTFSELDKIPVKVVNSTSIHLSDVDAQKIVRGTVTVVGFQSHWQDSLQVLGADGSAMNSYQGVTISYENGQLSFEGEATLQVYENILKKVHYSNPNPCPPSLSVLLKFDFIDDCEAHNEPVYTNISIDPDNDPPTIDLDTTTSQDPLQLTYQFFGVENTNPQPLVLFERAALDDCDTMHSMEYLYIIMTEAGDLETNEEWLEFDLSGTALQVHDTSNDFEITYMVTPLPTAVVPPSDFQMVLRRVKYRNVARKPFETSRELTVRASDDTRTETASAILSMDRVPLGPTITLGK